MNLPTSIIQNQFKYVARAKTSCPKRVSPMNILVPSLIPKTLKHQKIKIVFYFGYLILPVNKVTTNKAHENIGPRIK